jgi:hypothetical protein
VATQFALVMTDQCVPNLKSYRAIGLEVLPFFSANLANAK